MRLAAVFLALLLPGCVGSVVPLDLPGIPATVDPTLALSTPDGGVGHGCTVNGYAITARHVMLDENTGMFQEAAYSQGGVTGIASINGYWSHLDLVSLALNNGGKDLTKGSVKVGDMVFWFEYDFRTRKNLLRARRRFASVLRIVAHQIVLDSVPVAGASGSCLLNKNGEVVGIVNASWATDDQLNGGNAVLLPELL